MTEQSREQLIKLATPIPRAFIGDNGQGKDAADHTVSTQWLLLSVGPYDLKVVEKLYSVPKKGGESVLNGVIIGLTCTVDGRPTYIEEVGGVENAGNIDGDGERLKHAMSDAIKRASMRLGVGLNIWSQDKYFLHAKLSGKKSSQASEDAAGEAAAPPAPSGTPESDPEPSVDNSSDPGHDDEELPEWMKNEAPVEEKDIRHYQGAASNAKGSTEGEEGRRGPTENQIATLQDLATQLRGKEGVQKFEEKNGVIKDMSYDEARKHIRELGQVVNRSRKSES